MVVIFRAGLVDFRLRPVQLRLAEFYDRAQSQFVARLGKVARLRGFFQQLIRHRKALVGRNRIEPGFANVADNPVLQVAKKLLLRPRIRIGFGTQGPKFVAIEDRNVEIESCRRVAIVDARLMVRRQARRPNGGECRKPQIALRRCKALR